MQANRTDFSLVPNRTGRLLRRLGALWLAVIISACGGSGSGSGSGGGGGGGGGSGAAATLATLEVTPTTATVVVGGTAQYSVVARDGTGLVMATPPVVWASGTLAVGTITQAGLAAGVSLGQTSVTAMAGSVVSRPAVLNVVAQQGVVSLGACDGIEAVPQWDVNLRYFYQDSITTSTQAVVDVAHFVSVTATIRAASPVGGILEWSGSLAGAAFADGTGSGVHLDESLNDTVTSDPTTVATVKADGPPVPTDGVDGFTLKVDLSTCTFQFTMAPSVHATFTRTVRAVATLPGPDEGTTVTTGDIALGLLQKGITPLGSWRTLGMGDFSDYKSFDSYSIAFVPVDTDAYIPSGAFAQAAFWNPPSAAPRGTVSLDGRADVFYNIFPHF
jgi:hypothetical protein